MKYYLDCWKKYVTFAGRARRKEYWMFVLFNMIAAIIVSIIDTVASLNYVLSGLYSLAVLLPALSVLVRRLHDTGRSGAWVFIAFVPIVGGIWLFVLTLLDSQAGENTYGPNPKAEN